MRVDVAKDVRKSPAISKRWISIPSAISASFTSIGSSLPGSLACELTPSMQSWPLPAQVQWSAMQPTLGQPIATLGGSGDSRTMRRGLSRSVVRPVVGTKQIEAVERFNATGAYSEG